MTTTKFRDLCYQVADQFGVPDARILVVDHPLGATQQSTILDWADSAVDDVVKLFTATDHTDTSAFTADEAPTDALTKASVPLDPDLEPTIRQLQELIRADGGDLLVTSIDRAAGTIELSLVVEGAECIECVMPREFLEQIALTQLAEVAPDIMAVTINDPRES